MVSPDARIVAFLDSDDVWDPGHLSRAERALSLPDIEVYWAGVSGEAFSEDYIPVSQALPASQARAIDTFQDSYCVQDMHAVLCGAWWRHMHLSSTVISARLARRLRFEEHLKLSEDFAFLLDCAASGVPAVASDAPGVTRGQGANLWHGISFDDERVAAEKFIMMQLYKKFRRSPRLSAGLRRIIDARIEGRRQQFFWNQVRRIRSGKSLTLLIWLKWMIHDPVLMRTVLGRVFGRAPDPGRYVIPLETA
jgi:succinoglycan biosynthesis protein ExoW